LCHRFRQKLGVKLLQLLANAFDVVAHGVKWVASGLKVKAGTQVIKHALG
jgi:hypothetical protein